MIRPQRDKVMQAGILERVSKKGLAVRLTVMASVLIVIGLLICGIGVWLFQSNVQTALIALAAVVVSGILAHVCGEYPRGDELIFARLALGMAVRTALPLIVAVWAINFANPPFEKSLVFYMILFYLIGMVLDVQLHLCRLKEV